MERFGAERRGASERKGVRGALNHLTAWVVSFTRSRNNMTNDFNAWDGWWGVLMVCCGEMGDVYGF